MKKRIILILLFVLLLSGCSVKKDKKYRVVTTNFAAYDFAKKVFKDDASISLIVKPGQSIHGFDPSAKDVIEIKEADLFIYNGGESDEWIEDIKLDDKKTFVMSKYADKLAEDEKLSGLYEDDEHAHEHDHDEEEAFDEHIWTSIRNSVKIIKALGDKAAKDLGDTKYQKNASDYILELENLDNKMDKMIKAAPIKELIVADKFPFIYFAKDYGLTYTAAFPGCFEETEVNAKQLTKIIERVKELNINNIFYIDGSSRKVSSLVAKETGAKEALLHSAHFITKDEFAKGISYLDIMNDNYETLKKALYEVN